MHCMPYLHTWCIVPPAYCAVCTYTWFAVYRGVFSRVSMCAVCGAWYVVRDVRCVRVLWGTPTTRAPRKFRKRATFLKERRILDAATIENNKIPSRRAPIAAHDAVITIVGSVSKLLIGDSRDPIARCAAKPRPTL
ncbi:uncharacterized protein LOC143153222 [Ptiloglossa arizonensis]|uniref:uncharacterized protein LOC143153222 n=1 Tax=Ptiloglossa arizonensis TaxID=3350558 RepID=UPI003F9ECEB3